MPGTGTVLVQSVWDALDECMIGWRTVGSDHYWTIYPPGGGDPYRSFPLGPHGNKKKARVEKGHVRKMARFLGILECVQKNVAGL